MIFLCCHFCSLLQSPLHRVCVVARFTKMMLHSAHLTIHYLQNYKNLGISCAILMDCS